MDIVHVILTSLGSIITLFILTKLMGNRELSQLTMFDYINSITIGSIAAEMATTEFTDAHKPFIAMIVYGLITLLIDISTNKSILLRRFFTGKPTLLYDKGEIYYKNLCKAKMDLGEFLTQCRVNGYFDLSKIQTAILESNGKISILPLSSERPITPNDLDLTPAQEYIVANVIIDGCIMQQNLKHTGNDEKWLRSQLSSKGITKLEDVFLATCDMNNKLCIYRKMAHYTGHDFLE